MAPWDKVTVRPAPVAHHPRIGKSRKLLPTINIIRMAGCAAVFAGTIAAALVKSWRGGSLGTGGAATSVRAASLEGWLEGGRDLPRSEALGATHLTITTPVRWVESAEALEPELAVREPTALVVFDAQRVLVSPTPEQRQTHARRTRENTHLRCKRDATAALRGAVDGG